MSKREEALTAWEKREQRVKYWDKIFEKMKSGQPVKSKSN